MFPARFLPVAALVAFARPAAAQVEVQTEIADTVLEAGDQTVLQFTVTVRGNGGRPTNPTLPAPPGVRVGRPNVAPRSQISIVNGRMTQSYGITVTWSVSADKPGKYRLGPPSVEVEGKRTLGEARELEVVAPGTLPKRPRRLGRSDPTDPFDMFRNFPGFPGFPGFPSFPRNPFPFPDDQDFERELQPNYPPELAQDRALDPLLFVVAKATPTRVVVGQAVKYRIYAYGSQGIFQPESLNEPSRPGFISYSDSSSNQATLYPVTIEGRSYVGARISTLVLFPIQSGTLQIGASRVGFSGNNYRPTPPDTLVNRETAPLDIIVSEPPLQGRPPGYRIGDVGRFTLTATVDPLTVRQGEAVSVVAKLEGTGNPPNELNLPRQSGVEWQTPSTVQKAEAVDGVVRGERVFTYVVKLDRAGKVPLGELSLPLYDADARRYTIARAALPSIEVTPNPAAAKALAAKKAEDDRLRDLLKPQRKLRATKPVGTPLADRRLFWVLLALGPLGVVSLNVLSRFSAKLAVARAKRREAPSELALQEIVSAHVAKQQGDEAALLAAVERAVHHVLEAATGVKSRGVLRQELAETLCARGFDRARANEAVALLEATEQARFAGAHAASHAELVTRTENFVRSVTSGKHG